MTETDIINEVGRRLGAVVVRQGPISGGDISRAWKLALADGRQVFLKYNTSSQAGAMFRAEAQGLRALANTGVLRVPEVLDCIEGEKGSALLVEYIASAPRSGRYWEELGAGLAQLHRVSASQFGWEEDNYIGTLPQSNRRWDRWSDFYIRERLAPLYEGARRAGWFGRTEDALMEAMYRRVEGECPDEPPALIHGDLWGGNHMTDEAGRPVLIDPAVYYGHREMDLAMSLLFGGFAPAFYECYAAAYPMVEGWRQRMDMYQLYYLLVHVHLFGAAYVEQVGRLLSK
jgi:protein-ribulosamine 3-kinase